MTDASASSDLQPVSLPPDFDPEATLLEMSGLAMRRPDPGSVDQARFDLLAARLEVWWRSLR